MALLSALYYPYARFDNESLLKHALLLWDRVEYIAPYPRWTFRPKTEEAAAAAELIAAPHVPSEPEKDRAHTAVEALVRKGLPPWFFLTKPGRESRFGIYPEKFAYKTWRLLLEANLAGRDREPGMLATRSMALTLMGILADTCAGTQKRLVTDEAAAYSVVNRYLAAVGDADLMDTPSVQYHRLLTLSLQAIDVRAVSLKALVRVRQREDAEFRRWRHNYLARLERQAESLSRPGLTVGDRKEVDRAFLQEMQDDLVILRGELKGEGKKALISKEVAAAAALIALGVVVPATAIPAGAGAVAALWRGKVEYSTARKKIFSAHSGAWLYNIRPRQRW